MILYLNLLTSLIMATTDTASSPRFTPQDLPYAYDALAPAISEETMHYHHDKHYAGYVDKLNELIVDTPFAGQPLEDIILSADGPVYNNAAQAWNHAFFFGQLSPKPRAFSVRGGCGWPRTPRGVWPSSASRTPATPCVTA